MYRDQPNTARPSSSVRWNMRVAVINQPLWWAVSVLQIDYDASSGECFGRRIFGHVRLEVAGPGVREVIVEYTW